MSLQKKLDSVELMGSVKNLVYFLLVNVLRVLSIKAFVFKALFLF